jgi:hypothetical protein
MVCKAEDKQAEKCHPGCLVLQAHLCCHVNRYQDRFPPSSESPNAAIMLVHIQTASFSAFKTNLNQLKINPTKSTSFLLSVLILFITVSKVPPAAPSSW